MSSGSRTVLLMLAGMILAGAVIALSWFGIQGGSGPWSGRHDQAPIVSSERAYSECYLDPVAGRPGTHHVPCVACHVGSEGLPRAEWDFLVSRASLDRRAWAAAIPVTATCGLCHATPDPAMLPCQSWEQLFPRMDAIRVQRKFPALTARQRQDVFHYFLTFSRVQQPRLSPDPDPAGSPIRFASSAFGTPPNRTGRSPVIGHLQIVDLDRDSRPDVLVCDTDNSQVTWVHRSAPGAAWQEDALASVPYPVHTQTVTNVSTGSLDIVVACQRQLQPTEERVGSVVLLVNDGRARFKPATIAEDLPRVADVEPADFNGDGRVDFVVAGYGYIDSGEIGWLEGQSDGTHAWHPIVKRSGAIHVPTADLNGDGHVDVVALFAQEHEMISAFLNDGHGHFAERVLFKAATPSFGSSGIQLVDLDRDGDLDVLYTNGDNMDLPTAIPRPYHGVQWLENKGNLLFEWHDILRYYGAYSAVAADLSNDGHLDIVVGSLFNDWKDEGRDSLIWLRNDGHQNFTAFGIARAPIALVSVVVGDLDGDGRPDVLASGFNASPDLPYGRSGRVNLWRNQGMNPPR